MVDLYTGKLVRPMRFQCFAMWLWSIIRRSLGSDSAGTVGFTWWARCGDFAWSLCAIRFPATQAGAIVDSSTAETGPCGRGRVPDTEWVGPCEVARESTWSRIRDWTRAWSTRLWDFPNAKVAGRAGKHGFLAKLLAWSIHGFGTSAEETCRLWSSSTSFDVRAWATSSP